MTVTSKQPNLVIIYYCRNIFLWNSAAFPKYAISVKWWQEISVDLHRVVIGIKHQNQSVKFLASPLLYKVTVSPSTEISYLFANLIQIFDAWVSVHLCSFFAVHIAINLLHQDVQSTVQTDGNWYEPGFAWGFRFTGLQVYKLKIFMNCVWQLNKLTSKIYCQFCN